MKVIDVEGVTLSRGGRTILRGVNWSIRQGEHWALLGANGSGKTTLLKVITGYEWPSEGHVCVLGKRYGECDLRELRKSIGWVSSALDYRMPRQDTTLEIVASGFDSSFGLYRSLDSTSLARCHEALEMVGARDYEKQSFETLSQGEQKRTLIARALVNRPALIVLDEPCAGLDPASRTAFLDDLTGFARLSHAPTIIFVTHHVEEIRPWINRALVLKEGAVSAKGAVEQVLTSTVLSDAFSHPCEIVRETGGYRLNLSH